MDQRLKRHSGEMFPMFVCVFSLITDAGIESAYTG